MDPQDPQNSNNPTPPSPGERPAPETPSEGVPGIPQGTPHNQPPPSSPSTGAYPGQTTSQPAWPPYPQGGQESYPQQPQSYPPQYPPQQPPTQDQRTQGSYMPGAPPPGAQGGYYQPDYRPPSQGGYSAHEQPTQAYGQGQGPGQGPGGYQGYPAYPPQQGGTHQYNVNAPKKGTPAWIWAVIGAVVLALVGGALLYFFVLSPKPNTVAGNNTPQPTVVAGQPTTTQGQPTTGPSDPTAVPTARSTIARNTPVPPTTSSRPTSIIEPTAAPTSAEPRPTTVPGQGGFAGTPRDATVAFFNYLRDGDYASANALLAPEIAPFLGADLLEQFWQPMQSLMVGDVQVGQASESGNTATVPIELPIFGGSSQALSAELRKEGDRWYIVNPFGAGTGVEIPTLVP